MKPPVLVVDDDPAFNMVLVRTLGRRGQPAIGAMNAEEALGLARREAVDRIILDLNLHGTSGLATGSSTIQTPVLRSRRAIVSG